MSDIIDRFMNKVVKGDNDCWEWTANRRNGYGRFKVDGRLLTAHRVSYELFVGEIPKGMLVLHKCDNCGCVNPQHLWLGTQEDNVNDMMGKGRHNTLRGDDIGTANLTVEQVIQIKKMLKTLRNRQIVAEKFGVTRTCIRYIDTGQTWSHVVVEE